jgi:hypothetical protein
MRDTGRHARRLPPGRSAPGRYDARMPVVLEQAQVEALCDFVDDHIEQEGCDHSLRFTQAWAQARDMSWDDLFDALSARGGRCDCEVVLNLDIDEALVFEPPVVTAPDDNRWLLPPGWAPGGDGRVTRMVISRDFLRKTHSRDGEWLIPAPPGAKPRKRMLARQHFYVGCDSGLPAHVGIVEEIEPIAVDELVRRVTTSTAAPELAVFEARVAAFMQERLARIPTGTLVDIDIVDRVGISRAHRELNFGRLLLRR